jgi:hypothetical protein
LIVMHDTCTCSDKRKMHREVSPMHVY